MKSAICVSTPFSPSYYTSGLFEGHSVVVMRPSQQPGKEMELEVTNSQDDQPQLLDGVKEMSEDEHHVRKLGSDIRKSFQSSTRLY